MTNLIISTNVNSSIIAGQHISQIDDSIIANKQVKFFGKEVLRLVSLGTNISPELLLHHSRCKSYVSDARQLAMYLLHVCMGRSMSEVGRFFGRDRTTVSHACNRIEDRRDDVEFDEFIAKIEYELDLMIEKYDAGLWK